MNDSTNNILASLNSVLSADSASAKSKDGLVFLNDNDANDSILLRSKFKKDVALYEALDRAYHAEIARMKAEGDEYRPIQVKRVLTVRFLDDRYQGEVAQVADIELV